MKSLAALLLVPVVMTAGGLAGFDGVVYAVELQQETRPVSGFNRIEINGEDIDDILTLPLDGPPLGVVVN